MKQLKLVEVRTSEPTPLVWRVGYAPGEHPVEPYHAGKRAVFLGARGQTDCTYSIWWDMETQKLMLRVHGSWTGYDFRDVEEAKAHAEQKERALQVERTSAR